jgi:Prion-inhibition and propagation
LIIFQRISEDFGEYRQLAGKEDPEYQRLSPVLNSALRNGQMDVNLKHDIARRSGPGIFQKLNFGGKKSDKSIIIGTKWALFQKDRFERVLKNFQKRVDHLQQILPHAIYALLQQGDQTEIGQKRLINDFVHDPDGKKLGVSRHAQINGISFGIDVATTPVLNLANSTIETTDTAKTLYLGRMKKNLARGNVSEARVLVEYKNYAPGSTNTTPTTTVTHPNVTELAKLLYSSGENGLGTLPFQGFADQPTEGRFAFVFSFPEQVMSSEPPETFHAIISQESSSPWRLSLRFKTAQTMAMNLNSFHLGNWLHKNVSSHSLVFLKDSRSQRRQEEKAYLVDFEFSRPESGTTMRHYDGDVAKNLYRHPDIQNQTRPSFTRLHDIYSLGVVLLEIAVWQTADEMVERAIPVGGHRTAARIRDCYIELAKEQIPHRMGTAYRTAVLACLTSEFEAQFQWPRFPALFRKEVIDNLSAKALIWELKASSGV